MESLKGAQMQSLDEELGQNLGKAWTVLGGRAWMESLDGEIELKGQMESLDGKLEGKDQTKRLDIAWLECLDGELKWRP